MKRILFLMLAASVIAVAAVLGHPNDDQNRTTKTVFLDRLKPGQAVVLNDKQGCYEIGIFPKEIQPLSHSVIEVGQDYVVLRDLANVTDTIVPIYSIKCIRILRVGNGAYHRAEKTG